MGTLQKLKLPSALVPLLVFLVALGIRLLQNLALSSYCVCDYGYAGQYLSAALRLAHGTAGAQAASLPVSGWPYIVVLSLFEKSIEAGTGSAALADHCLQFTVLNSVLDALACSLLYWVGMLAFDRATALAGAIIFACYPPAILSTQYCLGEPFAYLILTGWTVSTFAFIQNPGPKTAAARANWFILGALTGFLVASKPALMAIPLAVALAASMLRAFAGQRGIGFKPGDESESLIDTAENFSPPPGNRSGQPPAALASSGATAGKRQAEWSGARSRTAQATWSGLPEQAAGDRLKASERGHFNQRGKTTETRPPERRSGAARWLASAVLVVLGLSFSLRPLLSVSGFFGGNAAGALKQRVTRTLVTGNDTAGDGWRLTGDSSGAPIGMSDALGRVCLQAADNPFAFVSLELRKVIRLWCPAWNPLQHHWLLLSPEWQEILHEDLLAMALVGLAMLLPAGQVKLSRRSSSAGVVLGAIILAHNVYLPFEPVARNALTAMPFIALLAASAFTRNWRRPGGLSPLVRLVAVVTLAFWALHHLRDLRPFIAGVFSGDAAVLVPWVVTVVWLLALICSFRLILPLVSSGNARQEQPARTMVLSCLIAAAVISVPCLLAEPSNREWRSSLGPPGVKARQDIYTPRLAVQRSFAPTAFVLVDLDSDVRAPLIKLYVNGVQVDTLPVPWVQLKADGGAAAQALLTQARAMGVDARGLRSWWALPVPTALLRYDTENEFVLSSATADPYLSATIYGDYPDRPGHPTDGIKLLPTFEDKISLAKGFFTFADADPRPYKVARVLGRTAGSYWFDGKVWQSKNMSNEDGTRCGEWRIRLAIPFAKNGPGPSAGTTDREPEAQTRSAEPLVFVSDTPPHGVSARDPYSMLITASPLRVPSDLPSGTRLSFGAELKDFQAAGTAVLVVEFAGEESGKTVTWVSPWQPSCIGLDRDFMPVSVADVIPDRILRLQNLRVRMYVKPFHDDLWKLRPAEALTRSIAVQRASLTILPPLDLPPRRDCEWLVY